MPAPGNGLRVVIALAHPGHLVVERQAAQRLVRDHVSVTQLPPRHLIDLLGAGHDLHAPSLARINWLSFSASSVFSRVISASLGSRETSGSWARISLAIVASAGPFIHRHCRVRWRAAASSAWVQVRRVTSSAPESPAIGWSAGSANPAASMASGSGIAGHLRVNHPEQPVRMAPSAGFAPAGQITAGQFLERAD